MREEDNHYIIIGMIHLPNTVKGPSPDNVSARSAASKAATNVEVILIILGNLDNILGRWSRRAACVRCWEIGCR